MVFENVLKRGHRCGNLCNDSCLNVYKDVFTVVCHGQTYQKRMIKAFHKKVRCQVYKVGDLVIKHIILPQIYPRGKWTPTYEGPFVIKKIFFDGAMILNTMDGDDLPHPANADIVKRYYT